MLNACGKVVQPFKKPGSKEGRSLGSSIHENRLPYCKFITKIYTFLPIILNTCGKVVQPFKKAGYKEEMSHDSSFYENGLLYYKYLIVK